MVLTNSIAEPIAASFPALPDGVTGSETALVFCGELTFDRWKTFGQELSQSDRTLTQSSRSMQWWIADWWCYGKHNYGERKAKLEAKKLFGRKFQTLANYGSCARNVETSRRREDLSVSHHMEVTKLKPEEQTRWLATAAQEGLSVSALRQKISDAEWVEPTDEQERQRFLAGLITPAKIDDEYTLVPPSQYPELEDHLVRYFRQKVLRSAGSIAEEFERVASHHYKVAEILRRVDLKVRNPDRATPDVRTVAEAESEIEISIGLMEER
jgi:hypothetical protein